MRFPERLWAISLCLVVIAWGSGLAVSPSWAGAPDLVLKLYGEEYIIEPADAHVAAGDVRIMFFNEGTLTHAVAIEGRGKEALVVVPPGETRQVVVNLKRGNYTFYCPRKGHREKGMVGQLRVY